MSFIYLLAFLAPLGIAALITSGLVGLLVKFGESGLKRFAPAAQFRLIFTAAVLPVTMSLIFLIGSSVGWKFYGVTQLCLEREKSGHLSNLLALFSVVFIAFVLIRLGRLASSVRKEHRFFKLMEKSAIRAIGNSRVVPLDEPQAFVLGFIKPKIYLSRGLFKKFDKNSLKTIVAHEKAHLNRRDPLRRLLASIALVFHLPKVAAEINQQLGLIQELIADNAAADKSECRLNLAQILVGFARLRGGGKVSAFEFGNSFIEIRVRRLLNSDNNSAKISLAAFAFAGVTLLIGAVVLSQKLHLLYELMLSLY
jgi:Zn-dependent protease with chaperone function